MTVVSALLVLFSYLPAPSTAPVEPDPHRMVAVASWYRIGVRRERYISQPRAMASDIVTKALDGTSTAKSKQSSKFVDNGALNERVCRTCTCVCSSSEDERDAVSEADEQWDDMAIVRVHRTTCTNAAMKFVDAQRTDLTLAFMYYQLAQAFEDALNDQRQRSRASTKVQKAKSSHSARKQLRRVPVDEEDTTSSTTPAAAASPGYGYTPTNPSGYQQSFAAQSQPQSQANGYAIPSASEHGSQNDIYQLAYAQAYASLQAQFQTAAHQPSPSQYPTGYGYGVQQAPGYPSRPSQHFQPQMPPSMPMPPFPSAPGVNAMPGANDDGLSNLLLAWYQSGYYTGRFQAIQEMKARNHR